MSRFALADDAFKRCLQRVRDEHPEYAPVLDRGVLPLVLDASGWFVVDVEGRLAWVSDDDALEPIDETHALFDLFAHRGRVYAAQHYPELGVELPQRGADCETCDVCEGSGTPPVPDGAELVGWSLVVCQCFGLGWLPNLNASTDEPSKCSLPCYGETKQ